MNTIKGVVGRAGIAGSALSTLFVLGFVLAGPASAAVDPVATAFDDMEAKVTTYGGAIVALVVVAAAIFLGVKYLKKGLSKA